VARHFWTWAGAGLKMYGIASGSKSSILTQFGAIPIDYRKDDFVEGDAPCRAGHVSATGSLTATGRNQYSMGLSRKKWQTFIRIWWRSQPMAKSRL
jgi:hypothetical protein